MTSEKLKQLNLQLTSNIRDIISEVEGVPAAWPDEVKTWMAEELADSVLRRTLKFYRGQKEHGGNFLTKEFQVMHAIQEEFDDAFWYFARHKRDIANFGRKLKAKDVL